MAAMYNLTNYGGYVLVKSPTNLGPLLKPIFNIILNKTSKDIFSITFAEDEISLIMTSKTYQNLFQEAACRAEQAGVYLCKTNEYCALQVDTDNPGLFETGIISVLTSKFAEYKIPVLCLSTYLGNYLFYPAENHEDYRRLVNENPVLFRVI